MKNLHIERAREYELDFAIEDLIERGYELVKRDYDSADRGRFNYDQSSRFRSDGSGVCGKYRAVLRKIEAST